MADHGKSGNACPLGARDARKLAKAARELAMECLTNGPEMENVWCGCAIGLSMKRAGLWPSGDRGTEEYDKAQGTAAKLDWWLTGASEGPLLLSDATRRRIGGWCLDADVEPTAVVIPLLAFADELEEAAQRPGTARTLKAESLPGQQPPEPPHGE